MQAHAFIGNGDCCPTLTEAMGMGGGQIPMILEAFVLLPKRTECEPSGNKVEIKPRFD